MRRRVPVGLVALGLLLLLGSYIWYAQRVVDELRAESERTSRMFARVYGALGDTASAASTLALFDLSQEIRDLGVPVIVTDELGRPVSFANIPDVGAGMVRPGDPRFTRLTAMVRTLDTQNRPVDEPGIGQIHFGNTPLVRGLRIIPLLQVAMLGLLIVAGIMALGVRARAERERVWAGMARESAHQLATPLSSLSGWLELLRERTSDEVSSSALEHMDGDLERLQRVSHRFERIGRPPRKERVELGALVTRVGAYFQARVPTLAHRVTIVASGGSEPVSIDGDEVLLEWALEVLVKNGLDALAGRGGRMYLTTKRLDPERVRIRVADDGPGVPRELRARIFDPGFSTKESGWGIGLSLAKRIVEENHGGRLLLVPSEKGATFDIILPG